MQAVPVDDAAWARARGWALWKAVKALPTPPDDHPRNNGTRLGWRWTARGVSDQIITDFRSAGSSMSTCCSLREPATWSSATDGGAPSTWSHVPVLGSAIYRGGPTRTACGIGGDDIGCVSPDPWPFLWVERGQGRVRRSGKLSLSTSTARSRCVSSSAVAVHGDAMALRRTAD